jgi:DNA repair protein RadC
VDKLYKQDTDGSFEPAAPAVVMATAAELAALELSRRGESLGPEELKPLVKAFLAKHDHELLCVAYLDAQERLIEFKVAAEGTVTEVTLPIREVIKAALYNTAVSVVLIHNHPGSRATPSDADKSVASFTLLGLKLFGVRVADSWIVAGDEVYSMRQHDMEEIRKRMPKQLEGLAALLKVFDDD